MSPGPRRCLPVLALLLSCVLAAPALAHWGSSHLAGTVTDASGKPVAGACVAASQTGDATSWYGQPATDATGAYSIPLQAGLWFVRLAPCGATFDLRYWPDQPTLATAVPVALALGETRVLDLRTSTATVLAPAPPVLPPVTSPVPLPPVAAQNRAPVTLANVPATGDPRKPVAMDALASRDTDGTVVDAVWTFDDGTSARGLRVSHTWAVSARHRLTVQAVDDDGAAGTTVRRSIVIGDPRNTASSGIPDPEGLCVNVPDGIKCQPGLGRHTPGGKANGMVSHKGWPKVTGVLWVTDHRGRSGTGTPLNDELLGGHGDDTLRGGDGDDILWGDMWPTGNNTHQRDVITGGNGDDWLYASHGHNLVRGDAGDDTIWSYFAVDTRVYGGTGDDLIYAKNGRGLIDCGPGRDELHVPLQGYTIRSCEVIHHYCTFGEDGHGGCKKPGERAVLARRR